MIKDIGFCFCFIATVCGTIEVKEVFPWPPVISFGENCLLYLFITIQCTCMYLKCTVPLKNKLT